MKWSARPLIEVADFVLGKMLDQEKNKGDLLPYLANVNVRWGEFELDNLRNMRFEAHEIERFSLKYGDIVMCEGGEPGRCAIWKSYQEGMMFQKALHRIRPHDFIDSSFLFYAFQHLGKIGGLSPFFTGATIKHLPREKLAKVEVRYPDIAAQKTIASVLENYDDLIETNRRRIVLLEESARLLYREWFVNMRCPDISRKGSNLPDGWTICSLGEMVTLNYGKSLKESNRIPGEISVFGSSGVVGTHSHAIVSGPALIVGRKGNVGSVFYSARACYPIDTVYFVEGNQATFYNYLLLETQSFVSSDTAVPGLNRTYACSLPVLRPSQDALQLFEDTVAPFFEQVDVLKRQNVSLQAARDELLPKLMFGAITV